MDLSDIVSEVADQERGAWLDIADPVTGEPTGIRFKIAGPDSETQHRAQLALADELTALAGPDGMVSAEQRERVRIACLAKCVLDWEVTENGLPVPFSHKNVVRVLRAAKWLQAQVDAFADDRAAFRGSK